MLTRRRVVLGGLALAGLAAGVAVAARAGTAEPAGGSTLNRPADPVVVVGALLPQLSGAAPGDIVGFRYDGGWAQIPVQTDEKTAVSFGTIYNFCGANDYSNTVLAYADPGTYVGPDANALFDGDDEVAFMSKDAGGQPPAFSEPADVVAGSGVRLTITDPLAPGDAGYVFLFRRSVPSLDPGAGVQYVDYDFALNAGTYPANYNTCDGPNAEDSNVTTAYYTHHFADRWISDRITITTGGSTGVDILDRHKPQFAPGNCVRTEDTFSDGEGAFIANKSGPVRAIRSYVGANSGPLTQRDHFFYERRQDIATHLRVHSIPSVMDYFDYSPSASGMTYYNDDNTGGVLIDGVPETPLAGRLQWEMVQGAQGSLAIAYTLTTNIPNLNPTPYYLDDSTPSGGSETQCTGDAFAYGSSGPWINQTIPCTDPALTCSPLYILETTRALYYDAPGMTVATAEARFAQLNTPLAVSVATWSASLPTATNTATPTATATPCGGSDIDADGVCDGVDNCVSTANAGQENSDANFIDLSPPKSFDDLTWTNSDAAGDACDPDDDNDLRSDADEASGAGCTTGNLASSATLRDSDGDRVLDRAECVFGYDPTNPGSKPPALIAPDADNDQLPDAQDPVDNDNDTDDDGLLDGVEYRYYSSNIQSQNTDGDACSDGKEVASVNNDQIVTSADLSQVAQSFGTATSPNYIADFDTNKDGTIASSDLSFVAQRFGSC